MNAAQQEALIATELVRATAAAEMSRKKGDVKGQVEAWVRLGSCLDRLDRKYLAGLIETDNFQEAIGCIFLSVVAQMPEMSFEDMYRAMGTMLVESDA